MNRNAPCRPNALDIRHVAEYMAAPAYPNAFRRYSCDDSGMVVDASSAAGDSFGDHDLLFWGQV